MNNFLKKIFIIFQFVVLKNFKLTEKNGKINKMNTDLPFTRCFGVVFGHAHDLRKFLGQGSNLCHPRDNAGFLIYWATTELLGGFYSSRVTHVFYFSFLAAPQHVEFPGQGSDLSHSLDLSCSCGNNGSLPNHARPGIEPASQHSQDAAHPTVPQQELLSCFLTNLIWLKWSDQLLWSYSQNNPASVTFNTFTEGLKICGIATVVRTCEAIYNTAFGKKASGSELAKGWCCIAIQPDCGCWVMSCKRRVSSRTISVLQILGEL